MNYTELINEVVKYKFDLIHFKKLLGEVKASIETAMFIDPKMKYHFEKIMKSLEANGVKGTFDSGREYRNYLRGVKND